MLAYRKWIALCWGVALAVSAGCGVMADGYNRRGVRSLHAGDYNGALQQFQQAAAQEPRNADAYYNMAATYHRAGKQTNNQAHLQQAERLYNQSLDIDNGHVDCYRGLAVLLAETGRSEKAIKLMNTWAQARPGDANARVELARLYQEFNNPSMAISQLEGALSQDSTNRRAWLALAKLREDQGNSVQALKDYQAAYGFVAAARGCRADREDQPKAGFQPASRCRTRTLLIERLSLAWDRSINYCPV